MSIVAPMAPYLSIVIPLVHSEGIPDYRDRGPCMVANDLALAEDFAGEDLAYRTQTTVIHDLAHILDRLV